MVKLAAMDRIIRFDRFILDIHNRQLRHGDTEVKLSNRNLDALLLLVSQSGQLVSKERFNEEVWRGVPVTDEALTQCIKMLRRQLADDVANPRFIETVPKHGYRFIAHVELVEAIPGTPAKPKDETPLVMQSKPEWWHFLMLGGAGTIGGGVAGAIGGIFYGFAAAAQPLAPGMGATSILLVILCLTILVALIGAAGVSFGIAAVHMVAFRPGVPRLPRYSIVIGGAAGGLFVGAFAKLLGLDAFNLLFGQSPGDITGAGEGLLLGGAVGLGIWLGARAPGKFSLGRRIWPAAMAGTVVGMLIPLLGGRLMAGSLDLLARQFPDSRLRLDQIGKLFGEDGFGPVSQIVTGGMEGALFCTCIAAAIAIAWSNAEKRHALVLSPLVPGQRGQAIE